MASILISDIYHACLVSFEKERIWSQGMLSIVVLFVSFSELSRCTCISSLPDCTVLLKPQDLGTTTKDSVCILELERQNFVASVELSTIIPSIEPSHKIESSRVTTPPLRPLLNCIY